MIYNHYNEFQLMVFSFFADNSSSVTACAGLKCVLTLIYQAGGVIVIVHFEWSADLSSWSADVVYIHKGH